MTDAKTSVFTAYIPKTCPTHSCKVSNTMTGERIGRLAAPRGIVLGPNAYLI